MCRSGLTGLPAKELCLVHARVRISSLSLFIISGEVAKWSNASRLGRDPLLVRGFNPHPLLFFFFTSPVDVVGNIQASHACSPGSIPGRVSSFLLFF